MRESGQLAGGAWRSEAARNRGAAHDGREPLATSEATSHRKPDAFDRQAERRDWALAAWTLSALVGSIPKSEGIFGLERISIIGVLGFAIALTIATGVLFGLAPALRATHTDLQGTLKDQGANVSGGTANVRLRKWLLVSQVALTVILLAGAGFFTKSLLNLKNQDLGLRTDHVLQFAVSPDLNPQGARVLGSGETRRVGGHRGVLRDRLSNSRLSSGGRRRSASIGRGRRRVDFGESLSDLLRNVGRPRPDAICQSHGLDDHAGRIPLDREGLVENELAANGRRCEPGAEQAADIHCEGPCRRL